MFLPLSTLPCPAYLDSGDPNSSPHACMANPQNHLASQNLMYYFYFSQNNTLIFLIIIVHARYMGMHAMTHIWKSEGNFWESVLSIHLYVSFGDQVTRLACKVLLPTEPPCWPKRKKLLKCINCISYRRNLSSLSSYRNGNCFLYTLM